MIVNYYLPGYHVTLSSRVFSELPRYIAERIIIYSLCVSVIILLLSIISNLYKKIYYSFYGFFRKSLFNISPTNTNPVQSYHYYLSQLALSHKYYWQYAFLHMGTIHLIEQLTKLTTINSFCRICLYIL